MKTTLTALLIALCTVVCGQQTLQPGFDKAEYAELLRISAHQLPDSAWSGIDENLKPRNYARSYRSEEMGLKNQWDLWEAPNADAPLVVSIRGTVADAVSWLANFYAAMSPAQGHMTFSDNFDFSYHLADSPRASVHTGWLIGMAFLWRDMEPILHKKYEEGKREMIIMGHSQGGGIAYLLTSHLRHQQKMGRFPQDWQIKTYCSAAPKPGNLYYAYDYEHLISGGWGFNVINALDWVPEVPLTVQTIKDFNAISPLSNIEKEIKKQKFPRKTAYKHVYKQLSKPALKANKRYKKYFGKKANGFVEKTLPGFVEPEYANTNNYMRAGIPIVLMPDEDYFKIYPDDPQNGGIFTHHLMEPYMYLLERLPE